MTIADKIKLVEKPIWTYKDIMSYIGIGHTSAGKVKNDIIAQGGGIQYSNKYVRSEAVLNYLGTTREEEIKVLKALEEREVKE